MGAKRKLLLLLLLLPFAASVTYLLLPTRLKLSYSLDGAHRARVEPQGTWTSMSCPLCGKTMERIVLDSDEPYVADEPWRCAYYCQREDLFWVADYPGGISSSAWYGPFNAGRRLTTVVAATVLVACGVSMIFVLLKRRNA